MIAISAESSSERAGVKTLAKRHSRRITSSLDNAQAGVGSSTWSAYTSRRAIGMNSPAVAVALK
jgi:hypothetical protein